MMLHLQESQELWEWEIFQSITRCFRTGEDHQETCKLWIGSILEDVQDYILKDIKNCTSVYLYADREFRKNRVKEIYGSNAEIMDKEKKNRADYYNYYTGNRWGDINNYDFAINTSKVSFEEAADLIYRFAKDKQKNLKDR